MVITDLPTQMSSVPSAPSRARRSRPTQLPRVPSFTPNSRATTAIGRPVSRTIRTAPSLNSASNFRFVSIAVSSFAISPRYEGNPSWALTRQRGQCCTATLCRRPAKGTLSGHPASRPPSGTCIWTLMVVSPESPRPRYWTADAPAQRQIATAQCRRFGDVRSRSD